jgi:hypothetical protein
MKQIKNFFVENLNVSDPDTELMAWILILFLFQKLESILIHEGDDSKISIFALHSMAFSAACGSVQENGHIDSAVESRHVRLESIKKDLLSGTRIIVNRVRLIGLPHSPVGVDQTHLVLVILYIFCLESVVWLYPHQALNGNSFYYFVQI